MIGRLVSFALNQKLFMGLITLFFIIGGVVAFKTLPVEAFPDVSDIQVNVITLYPGRAPEEVEKQVTIPLETVLAGLPYSVRMFSHTQFGLSFIVLTFDDKASDYFARQQVLERLTTADLPQGVQPQLAPMSTAIGEIFRYRLRGDGYSSTDLRTLEDWVVERQLRMTPGVADIVGLGGMIKTYEVQPDLTKLKYYGITLQQLFTAVGRGNANVGGSKVEQGPQQYLIRGIGLLRSADDIGMIVVTSRSGTPILIRDVATVVVGHVPIEGIVGQDEADDIVAGIVLMRKGENPTEVLKLVQERIDKLNGSVLPKGVRIVPYYDRTWLIGTTLTTVFHNLAEGAMLVTLVLFLFLGNVRAALIVAIMIPLSLLATFIGLTWRGIPANLLSLGAMDFGIIVDGAVIVVENIFRHLAEREHSGKHSSLKVAILRATTEVGRPTFFSMLIIIAAHLPIFTLQRHEGRIFAPMAWTVTSALVGSLFFSLSLVPLLCYLLLRKNIPHGDNRLVLWAKRGYEPILTWSLARPKAVVGIAVIALLASFSVVPRLGTEFLPELNEGTIWVNATFPAGISVPEARSYTTKMRQAIRTVPEVRSVISKAGRPEDGTDPKPINMAECFVDLKPQAEWRPGVTKEEILEQMDKALDVLPGVETSFSQPIRDNVLESISQIDGQVVIKVYGEDAKILREQVTKVLRAVSHVRGVTRAFIDRAGEVPQSLIEIDRSASARRGLNIGDVNDVVEMGLAGKSATEIWEGEKHFSVLVRLPERERGMGNLRHLLVDTPDNQHIPLGQIAAFRNVSGSMNISRENGTRVTAIGIFIKGRDMGSVVADMQEKVKSFELPKGYQITWSGEFENQQRAMSRLAIVVPVSVLIIFALLFNAFQSVKSSTLILLNVPFALIGGIFALLLTHIPLSVSAAIGFIALFGQAVLNGVVMVSCFNQLVEEGQTPAEAVRDGALLRLRTVLMTALLAMLGLLPMALSHGIGSETQKPLAVVIIGGLVSATALTLIVLPVLYLVFNRTTPGAHSKAAKHEDHGGGEPGTTVTPLPAHP
ncbi:MAG: efflux RND transporter permease subunit [Verrucomicrobia bacterium]|nr:efflux RND transporter permease subunit [Verrucomicrobiota bacterium]MBI3868599.1 efflux RND transporter permease subunit [Verrucomicrobiota bacterium]